MADWTEGRGERRRGKGKASEQKSDDDAARGREATSIGELEEWMGVLLPSPRRELPAAALFRM